MKKIFSYIILFLIYFTLSFAKAEFNVNAKTAILQDYLSGKILFINSSSGETPSILLFAEQAIKEKGEIFLTTCNKESSIGKLSNNIIRIPTIESVQLMKSPYEQFSMLLYDYIIFRLVETLGLDKEKNSSNHSILE